MTDTIVLRSGCAPWLTHAQSGAALLALALLLQSGAAPAWIGGAVAALAFVHVASMRRMQARDRRGRLHLAADGSALLFTPAGLRAARQRPGAWVSRALCVLPLQDRDSGRRFRCVLCRSLNAPAPWRRLQARLNTADGRGPGQPR